MNGMGSHQSARMLSDEWFTPFEITKELGPFDMDVCTSECRPWDIGKINYTTNDNGLLQDWDGFVWCNPPYGLVAARWLERMSMHNNGIALIFARTETLMFQEYVWNTASALFFIYNRLFFYNNKGERSKTNSGAPSVLVGYGNYAKRRLFTCRLKGKYIEL